MTFVNKIKFTNFLMYMYKQKLIYLGFKYFFKFLKQIICLNVQVCPVGIYEPSESKASGLGSLIKNYLSPWPGFGSHIYTLYAHIYTLSGAESLPWINSPLASNHFVPGPGSSIKSSSRANTIISIN